MPNRDKTGPEDKEPMTGRGMGGCSSKDKAKNLSGSLEKVFRPKNARQKRNRRGKNMWSYNNRKSGGD